MNRFVILLALAAGACGPELPDPTVNTHPQPPEVMEPQFARDIQPIFDKHCGGCHDPQRTVSIQRPMLGAKDAFDYLTRNDSIMCFAQEGTSMAYVVPFDPSRSAILYVMRAETSHGGCTTSMPKAVEGGLAAADPDAVKQLRRWIELGAKND